MPFTTITIDFWQTLYDNANGAERNAQRKTTLLEAIGEEHQSPDLALFDKAYAGLWEYFDQHWLGGQRTPTSEEMVAEILRQLQFSLSEERTERVVKVFEEGILDHSPGLLPGVREGLQHLASFAPLALISDTAFSPGSVLRRLMERDNIAQYFQEFVFSDETGVAKPHPEAFLRALEPLGSLPETALHIGDIERTDIRGAKGVGMRAILYRSSEHLAKYAEEETSADAVMKDWGEVGEAIQKVL
ncbi:MAG: HAD family hydrolase [Candidatus Kapaibacterium sp.]